VLLNEIRAKISIEVSKAVSNAKLIASSFKTIASSAVISTSKLDAVIKKSSEDRLAQARRTDAQEIQSEKEKNKTLSKLELEKVRNTGGIKPGSGTGGREEAIQKKISDETQKRTVRQVAIEASASAKILAISAKTNAKKIAYESKFVALVAKDTAKRIALSAKEGAVAARESTKAFAKKSKDMVHFKSLVFKENRKIRKDMADAMVVKMDTEEFQRGMASIRYALYDVGRRAIAFGVALAGGITASVVAAAKFESAFTSVERTTGLAGKAADELRATLVEMSTVIPVSFEDLTNIATLGAQLGIAAESVDEFTETVAKFSAITGISVDQVGLSFGRLAQLIKVPVSEFENLSSAIAFTGVNAVATDAEILKMTESIGASSSMAGLSADEIVGLGSALASLKVRPEQARGVFIRLFRIFDTNAAGATAKMDDLAKVVGLTTDEAIRLYQTDPSKFFTSFLAGSEAAGTLNQTMAALGIVNVRELDVIQRLAGNQDVLNKALADSREQYLLGTYASEAYAQVQDDLSSKVLMMQNALAALAASFGDLLAPNVAIVVDAITAFLKMVEESNPSVKQFIMGVTALTAAAALLFGSLALGIAGLLALKLALVNLKVAAGGAGINMMTFSAILRSLIPGTSAASAALTMLGLKAKTTSTAFTFLGMTMRGVAAAATGVLGVVLMVIIPVIQAIGTANDKTAASFAKLGESALEANGGMSEAVAALKRDANSGTEAINDFTVAMTKEEVAARDTKESLLDLAAAMQEASRAGTQGELTGAYDKTTDAIELQNNELEKNVDLLSADGPAADEEAIGKQGEEYVKYLLKGARSYAKEDGSLGDLAVDYSKMDPATKAVLESLGFEWYDIFNSTVEDLAGDNTGGRAYVEGFQKQITGISDTLLYEFQKLDGGAKMSDVISNAVGAGRLSADMGKVLQGQFDKSRLSVDDFIKSIDDLPEGLNLSAKSADAMNATVESTANGTELFSEVLGDLGEEAEDLNDVLKGLITGLTAVAQVENQVSDALDTFAQGAKDTAGELDGMGDAARTNLSNFASFMQAATEASIAAGEGTKGALGRIVSGLVALENAGINTGDAFTIAKELIINNIIKIVPALEEMRASLGAETSLAGIEAAIRGFYALKMAADGIGLSAAIGIFDQMNVALEALNLTAGGYVVNLGRVSEAATKALTPLEKLNKSIQDAFKYTDLYSNVQDSLQDLGKSLKENGKDFTIYSEAGRGNMSSLSNVIDSLVQKSGGNVTKFANDLASLRAALVKSGASAGALKLVDKVTKEIGKTGKSSTNSINKFAAALKSTGESVRHLYAVKSAMDSIASGVREGFSAIFAQADALDAVSMGWLNLSDAADDARDSIANAGESIDDARLEIKKLDAEIQGLAADKGKLEYQLSIALKYGDTIRANQIRADLEGLAADVLSKEDAISDANNSISKSSEQIAEANGVLGNAPSLRQQLERNDALRDMALRYGDVAASLIANAKPGDDLNEIINKQVTAFEQSAIKMGYSKTEATAMADVLRDELIYQMNLIPEDITTDITAETSVATRAVNDFVNFANGRLNQIKDKTVTVNTLYTSSSGSRNGIFKGQSYGFSSGGFVRGPGSSTSDSIPANLSNGEYVMRASAVSKYGVDFFNSINQMKSAPAGMSSAVSQQSGGNGMVYLSPEDRQLLRAAIDRPISLYTDNTVIASSANKGNQILAQRGIK
jgi:TP901 family phage tail tape measure protein